MPLALLGACGADTAEGPRYRVDTGSGVALVYRESVPGLSAMDAASAGGVFRLRGACLVVDVGGMARTPVFPAPVRFDPSARAVAIGGKDYLLDHPYRFEFASPGEALPEPLTNASAFPASCPRNTFNFGGIAERTEADRPT